MFLDWFWLIDGEILSFETFLFSVATQVEFEGSYADAFNQTCLGFGSGASTLRGCLSCRELDQNDNI